MTKTEILVDLEELNKKLDSLALSKIIEKIDKSISNDAIQKNLETGVPKVLEQIKPFSQIIKEIIKEEEDKRKKQTSIIKDLIDEHQRRKEKCTPSTCPYTYMLVKSPQQCKVCGKLVQPNTITYENTM